MNERRKSGDGEGELLADLIAGEHRSSRGPGDDLVTEPSEPMADSFALELEKSLSDTEADAVKAVDESHQAQSWITARKVIERFQPVPWFIWRLTNYVFGQPGEIRSFSDGMVLGLRRLLFAAANDPFFSDRGRVNSVKTALEILHPDVVAAISVIHAICRRLASCQFERIWRPILDDALLRAQIGYFVGERNSAFGAGRGMLAGFAGRCGLAILIAGGNLEQARRALELLASGADIANVGMMIYGVDPLQVSAMALSASGCGRDSAAGTVCYAVSREAAITDSQEQFNWLAAFSIVELIRVGKHKQIDARSWESLGYNIGQDRGDLVEQARMMVRRGHSLPWIV